jgi:hypothetical protein
MRHGFLFGLGTALAVMPRRERSREDGPLKALPWVFLKRRRVIAVAAYEGCQQVTLGRPGRIWECLG